MVAWNRRGCFGWAGSNHHVHQGKAAKSTTPPCHHVAMPPPSHSVLAAASPRVQPPPVTPKGRGVTSTKFDSNIFCEKEVSWCHGGMGSGDETATHRLCVTVVGASAGPGWTTTCTE